MKAQFKYAALHSLDQRVYALAGMVLINLVFTVLALTGIASEAISVWGIVLSAISLAGAFAVNIMSDVQGFESVFHTPKGYLNMLTPVKSWKILLARVVTFTVADFICLAIAICGIVVQGLAYDNMLEDIFTMSATAQDIRDMVFITVVGFIGYAYILMLIAFGLSLKSAFFSGRRFGAPLTLLCVAAVGWVFNLFNFVLAPMGGVTHWWNAYTITLNFNSPPHILAFTAVSLIKVAALFVTSSALIERRINL